MASKQKDNRYRAKVTIGHDEEGRPVFKYASGRTKRELEDNKEELRRTYINGNTTPVQREITFEAYSQFWYDEYKKNRISAASKCSYSTVFNKHLFPVFSGRQLRAITADNLQAFMNSKAGLGVSSLGYMHSSLKGIFGTALARGIIDRDPAAALVKPSAQKESRRALTNAEREAALKIITGENALYERLLLAILYYTGLRIGEVLGLQWEDIDFKKRVLHVKRDIDFKTGKVGTVKTKAALRGVPIPSALFDMLVTSRGIGNTFVIQAPRGYTHLAQSTYKRCWNRLMTALAAEAVDMIETKLIGNKQASILTAHYFRHNYATMLYDAGVDILSAQRFLGHADVVTTMKIYSHLSEGKEDVSATKVRELFDKALLER